MCVCERERDGDSHLEGRVDRRRQSGERASETPTATRATRTTGRPLARSPSAYTLRSHLHALRTQRYTYNVTCISLETPPSSSAFERPDDTRNKTHHGVSGAPAALRAVSAAQGRLPSRRDPGHRLPGQGGERSWESRARADERQQQHNSCSPLSRPVRAQGKSKQGGLAETTRTPLTSHTRATSSSTPSTHHPKTTKKTGVHGRAARRGRRRGAARAAVARLRQR